MRTLILKLNATGDVVRTTPLLRCLPGDIVWVTAARNVSLLEGIDDRLTCLRWEDRYAALDFEYDLVINLEDEREVSLFARDVKYSRLFGANLNGSEEVQYTADSELWFDLSLISRHGRRRADELKALNRRSYQSLIFEALGFEFRGQRYVMPRSPETELSGDVAIAPVAGAVWPMKNWAYYDVLKVRLEQEGLRVNVLPTRTTLLEHLADVANHRCLVGGDSLPMHLALGSGVQCVSLFNCTSPWEIYDYGLMTKIVSPLLAEFFYKRGMDERAITAIGADQVFDAVLERIARVPTIK